MKSAPRVSLLNLFLLVTIGGVLVALYVVHASKVRAVARAEARAEQSREENINLLKELGRLAVEDPGKAYILMVQTDQTRVDPSHWRLRMHLPELPDEAIYSLDVVSGSLPPDGSFPDWDYAHPPSGGCSVWPGEYTLDLHLEPPQQEGDPWRLHYHFLGGSRFINQRPRGSCSLHMDCGWVLTGPHVTTSETTAVGFQEEYDPLKPIALLRFRKPFAEGAEEAKRSESLLVYLEPFAIRAKPKAFKGPAAGEYLAALREGEDESP